MTPTEPDLERRLRIDGICDEFESLLNEGKSPLIESFLDRVEVIDRPGLIQELAEVEVSVRSSRGESVSKEEILQRLSQAIDQTRDWQTGQEESRPRGASTTVRPEVRDVEATRLPSIEGFAIERKLGRGGMGVVYQARQSGLNRVVALKMIRAGQLADEASVKRFRVEAEAAAALDHPGIVPVYQVSEQDGQHFLAMGFVEGGSLSDRIAEGPLPPLEAAQYAMKIADAIAFAHEHGVIHRDLKPANVLLDREGRPKVTDFGLAKRVEGEADLTATGQILGTPNYMPPEQAAGRIHAVAETADIYSLGATLYALVTGRPPFQADNAVDTLRQVLDREPVAPRLLNPKIPKDLETICLKALEKDRNRRYASAGELRDELQRFLDGRPIRARPVSVPTRLWRWCRRNPRVAILSATAAGFALALMIGGYVAAGVINHQKGLAVTAKEAADEARDEANSKRREADTQRERAEASEADAKAQEELATEQSELALEQLSLLGRAVQDVLHKVPGDDAPKLRFVLLNTVLHGMDEVSDKGGPKSIISASALRRKGDVYMEYGEPDNALKAYQQCLDRVKSAADDPRLKKRYEQKPDIVWQNHALALDCIGDALLSLKKSAGAKQHYQEALDWRQKWRASQHTDERAQQEFATSLGKMGSWHLLNSDYEAALENYERSLQLRRQFYKNHPDLALPKRELGGALRSVGVAHKNLGNYGQAIAFLQEALPLLKNVLDQWQSEPGYQGEFKLKTNVALFQADLAETHLLAGDKQNAISTYGEAAEILSELHGDNPNHAFIGKTYWKTLYGLATCELQTDSEAAAAHFQTGLDLCSPDSIRHMLNLARCHRTDEASRLAEQFAKRFSDNGQGLYYAACGFALCAWSAQEKKSQEAFEQYARQAIKTISTAITKGFDSEAELKDNPELDAIRDLPEFSELLERIAQVDAAK